MEVSLGGETSKNIPAPMALILLFPGDKLFWKWVFQVLVSYIRNLESSLHLSLLGDLGRFEWDFWVNLRLLNSALCMSVDFTYECSQKESFKFIRPSIHTKSTLAFFQSWSRNNIMWLYLTNCNLATQSNFWILVANINYYLSFITWCYLMTTTSTRTSVC